jgi:hypothetical protein
MTITKARLAALQWFHERGEVTDLIACPVSQQMLARMIRKDGHLKQDWNGGWVFRLTDAGRQALHEGTRK